MPTEDWTLWIPDGSTHAFDEYVLINHFNKAIIIFIGIIISGKNWT